ncbi:hypothetical protein CERZMDRAFT_96660 [Cercospora zeae-maydis SCOH1-5]|uniref:Uncharacterized protein n=1 Tax=Cercospora zeae-maydis SCOH1-5 TaxID=717836 RepID=A0A6A6FIB0_9PEZI|nr:hypothetical protein CERZMDRAFT_96660 [Cercospora zeae-maydis SCOH1-5]
MSKEEQAHELIREKIQAAEVRNNLQSLRAENSQLRAVIDFQKAQYKEMEAEYRD